MKLVVHYDKPDLFLDILRRRHPDVELACCTDYESLPASLARERPEVLFTVKFGGTPGFPRAAILGSETLRWVSVGGSGTDHLAPWDPARMTITNAAGVAADVMAQYVIGGILHFTLGLPAFARYQRERRWTSGSVASVDGRTIAILGLGKTGKAVAKLAKALGMQVIGVRARPGPTANVDRVEPIERLHDVLRLADHVAICLPLTPATRGLIDAAAFRALQPGAILVDVSRGGIVHEAALIEALKDGRLAGAVLDVFEAEPLPPDHPLWAMENVIITPHCSSVYGGWERRAVEMFCDNLDRWLAGAPLENVVDPGKGY
ncbi:MAG TPA: D-2-hydroxyacid dehydrogenase [Dongiaceae bacterium]|jgi:phosphoglycerate dehydrogenase-like enzyme|nr:D-2-hydroxyacid dehydrogenase [Dongiaceae bacterium]